MVMHTRICTYTEKHTNTYTLQSDLKQNTNLKFNNLQIATAIKKGLQKSNV